MAKLVKILLVLIGLYVAVMIGSGLYIKSTLSGDDSSTRLREELSRRFQVEVELGEGDFDLAQWFLLRPAITIRDLSISNPDGFSDQKMIEAEEISAQMDLTALYEREVRIQQVEITAPELRIETDRNGRNNLASIAPASAEPSGETIETSEGTAVTIDGLLMNDGVISFTDLPTGETLRMTDVDLAVTNFSTDSQFDLSVSGQPFGGERSRVSFEGRAGPFLQTSFPADGQLQLALAVTDMPEDFRVKRLGESLRDPGPDSLVRAGAAVSGDLMGTLKGQGQLAFDDFEFGRDSEHRLPLAGEVPLDLTVKDALNSPVVDLSAPQASIRLGTGELTGDIRLAVGLGSTNGEVRGRIRDVDIDEILSTFTTSSGTIYGSAAIPELHLRFRGATHEQRMDSFTAQGRVTLDEGRITFMDTIESVLERTETILKMTGLTQATVAESGEEAPPPAPEGQTAFTTMTSDVAVANGVVTLTNIQMKSPSGDVTGAGDFDFETVMDFDLLAHLTGHVASALGGKPDENGLMRAALKFHVGGTFSDPVVRPNTRQLATSAGLRLIEGLLGGGKQDGAEGEEQSGGSILDIFRKRPAAQVPVENEP